MPVHFGHGLRWRFLFGRCLLEGTVQQLFTASSSLLSSMMVLTYSCEVAGASVYEIPAIIAEKAES